MDRVRCAIFVSAATVALGGATMGAGGAAVVLDTLVVRMYDSVGVAARERRQAMQAAGRILARADVHVEWVECSVRQGRASRRCKTPAADGDLVVRVVNAPPRDDSGQTRQALGYATIDTATGTGTMATVFIDRVAGLARAAGLSQATLLGRAVAHEIGHLVLGSNEHSTSGLMREVWTLQEITGNKADDWLFLPGEREQLRQARLLLANGVPTATVGRPGGGTIGG